MLFVRGFASKVQPCLCLFVKTKLFRGEFLIDFTKKVTLEMKFSFIFFKKFVIVQKILYIRSQIEGFCFIFK